MQVKSPCLKFFSKSHKPHKHWEIRIISEKMESKRAPFCFSKWQIQSITQNNQNDMQILKSSENFLHVFISLPHWKLPMLTTKGNAPATEIFQYLFLLVFSNRSKYMNLLLGKDTLLTLQRILYTVLWKWSRSTGSVSQPSFPAESSGKQSSPLDSKDCANVLIIDDSMFARNRSQKSDMTLSQW